jgi:transcriptional regulator with XRE-family HTH domain
MSKVHIGKKIREALNKSSMTVVEFAKKINLTRDGVYKILDKESVATDQLQKISEVLGHDFFAYYQTQLNLADPNPKYGYAAREDVEALTRLVLSLAKDIEKIQKDLSKIANPKTGKKKKVK